MTSQLTSTTESFERDETIDHSHDGRTIRLAIKRSQGAYNRTGTDQPASSDGADAVPGFVWLGGFRSDMAGTKADRMVAHARHLGCASLRFDYSGHGLSKGEFVDGTISRWVSESLDVVRRCSTGPQVLVGSSMGAWIALRLVQELARLGEAERVAALLLIAPAPDFTSELMEAEFTPEQRRELADRGYIEEPSIYSPDPNIITRALIEDGRDNRVLGEPLTLGVPVTILQGLSDLDVPWQHAMRLVEVLASEDVTMTLVKDGDHRLSRETDLALLEHAMTRLCDTLT